MGTIFKNYQKGEVIFRQGDFGDRAYLVESGSIQISIDKQGVDFPLTVLGPGEIFGEMAIIDAKPRSATATALEPTRLCIISQDSLIERMQNADSVVRLLLMMFTRRTREMHASLSAKTLDFKPHNVVNLDNSNKEALAQVRFESEVKHAFAQKEFRLNYQPIVALHDGRVVGFEALIRWHSPTLGIVRPNLFMGVIEDSAAIVPVGRWILEQAIGDLCEFQKLYGKEAFISINVSPRQFADPSFLQHLEKTRGEFGIDAGQIKLEITEQLFLRGASVIGMIDECRKLGYKVSLDDFGTGYSSISYLKEIEIDVLKIDQAFVRHIMTDKRAHAITGAMISLAGALGLECVAEGIESKEVAEELQKLGCKIGQGYFFGVPKALDQYTASETAA
jgi:EAL domain-containing protein (putative c-di-GMP-specific phosphodiesterase class I)